MRTSLVGLVLCLLAVGCKDDGGPGTLVFPPQATLGQTVALSIDTNQLPNLIPGLTALEDYELSRQNVTLEIDDDTGTNVITPLAVIEGTSVASSDYAAGSPGGWATIVVFDLPDTLQYATLPVFVDIDVLKDGQPVFGGFLTWSVKILPGFGFPTRFFPALADLETGPRLRVRGSTGAFDPVLGDDIGSIEFTLWYDRNKVAQPAAYPTGESAGGTVLLGNEVIHSPDDASVRVVLVDPKGFQLELVDVSGGVGEGPFLDVVFEPPGRVRHAGLRGPRPQDRRPERGCDPRPARPDDVELPALRVAQRTVTVRAALLVVAAALAAAPVATAQVPYRTIVVFGDTQTQIEAGERDPLDPLYVGYQAAIDWVVANKHTENIDLVLHTGDAVNNAVQYPLPGTCATTIEKELSECTQADCSPTIPLGCYELGGICRSCHRYRVRADAEWQVFLEPWRQLEPDAGSGWLGVPYAVVRGNHDNVGDTAPDLVETEGYDQYFGNAQQEALELEFVGSDRIFELLETCPATPQGAGEHCPNDPGHAWRMRTRAARRTALTHAD